jgi:thioredoxin-dependent peroxiredoxin
MSSVTLRGAKFGLEGELPHVGTSAPAMRLVDSSLGEHSLESFEGKTKVITFNPSVDTSVCATTVRAFNQKAAALPNTVVLAVSADLPFALKRFCGAEGIENVVAASTLRDEGLAKRWGLRIAQGPLEGLTARAVAVVGPDNVIKHFELVPEIAQEPDYDRALAAVQS